MGRFDYYYLRYVHKFRRYFCKRVSLKRLNGVYYKVVHELDNGHLLDKFAPTRYFPRIVGRTGAKGEYFWLEYINGSVSRVVTSEMALSLADIFGFLYGCSPRLVDIDETPYISRISCDIDFLHVQGQISVSEHRELHDLSRFLRPSSVWLGYDCWDASPLNLVMRADGVLSICDIEGLKSDSLIGYGLFDCGTLGKSPWQGMMIDHLVGLNAAPFLPYMKWIELHFLLHQMKRSLIGTVPYKETGILRLRQFLHCALKTTTPASCDVLDSITT